LGGNEVTITEAVRAVLKEQKDGMTAESIYSEIIARNIYSFNAKQPQHVMLNLIRRHCYGLDFPSAHPVKYFQIVDVKGKTGYALYIDDKNICETKKESFEAIKSSEDLLPEERIAISHREHIEFIKKMLLEAIIDDKKTKQERGAFFEKLVLDLIMRLGYGYGTGSGTVTGKSHDGGIDGIVYEDRLGLDKIYIQAKCYAQNNKVGIKEVQAFVGAMQNVQKGIFITSSQFTKEAIKFIELHQSKNVKLIDGSDLTEQMVKYAVGLSIVTQLSIYKIDGDYFSSEQ
jgi:restriction system protein